ncbi:dienelactone hydrolase family protein [Micromonospora sp. GCM10011542]|uniref:dienelactone hydrolase family protein n=1 Tax=Micromonospora sp. GCM10011542 TaxID=3317337 RepID=UPI00360827A6
MSAPSPHPRSVRAAALLAVLAVVAATLGAVVLTRADTGLTTRRVTVAGVPMTEVRAAAPTPGVRRPGVVVAHGFAGSARLMRPIADTVARQGGIALLLDFAGHGANSARLPGAGRYNPGTALTADLDVAVDHLRTLPDVDPGRIVLIGHSMGAGVVTRYAVAHPEIARTVAISLPDADDLPPGRPAGLLLIVGGAEFPDFRRTVDEAMRRGTGTERRSAVVPGAEHISVLFATRTHEEVTAWLPGADATARPRPTARLGGAGLLLLAFGLGMVPLAALLLPVAGAPAAAHSPRPPGPRPAAGRRPGWCRSGWCWRRPGSARPARRCCRPLGSRSRWAGTSAASCWSPAGCWPPPPAGCRPCGCRHTRWFPRPSPRRLSRPFPRRLPRPLKARRPLGRARWLPTRSVRRNPCRAVTPVPGGRRSRPCYLAGTRCSPSRCRSTSG